ncbi:MAG: MFS transporter [Propionibacteriaceae bacterium]|nr:MFS transporter [Propionibacteriaceae bacterium]
MATYATAPTTNPARQVPPHHRHHAKPARPSTSEAMRNQPSAVWAIAFACVVSFMGIGLVDPILPTIAAQLHASSTESELLFTTYLAFTGVAMFFTSWVSSRIGVKATLLIGLAVIVVFAVACSASPSVSAIIGFRAGWGLGNALFISTALSAIVSAATGGSAGAIILYECALGIGMAFGPLTGGALGTITWRAPFLGTATLMAIGLIAIAVLLKNNPHSKRKMHAAPVHLSAPFKAMTVPGMRTMSIVAFFYNMAFFTTLAYPPFALARHGVHSAIVIGLIFFGWGGLLALSAVFVAPRLIQRTRRTTVAIGAMTALAIVLIACALLINSVPGLIVAIILAGIPLGLLNTTLTECSMEASDLPRPVASSTYSGWRFLGGAIAPPLCTLLGNDTTAWMPFAYGALVIMISCLTIVVCRKTLHRADDMPETQMQQAESINLAAQNLS